MPKPLRIGVAEDERDMREYYGILISDLGHELAWAAQDGAELVELVQKDRPDLLIVDIQMPKLDGLDAVRILARDGRPIPVIVVSGYHDQETMERADAARLMGYLIKPIRESDLKTAINTAMQRFEELRGYREAEALRLQRRAQARQCVLQAIRVLSKSAHINRQQAFDRIKELARKEDRPLMEVAKTIIESVNGLKRATGADETEGANGVNVMNELSAS